MSVNQKINCQLLGVGVWGPGFSNWSEFTDLIDHAAEKNISELMVSSPKPEVIPANERRRSPLPVRAAVEVSWQALQQSGLNSSDVACVFGSGLGDTDITDYMCRVLITDEKQLSPTKFHNSVHNAAAGYWTISTGCMKSANSIAAYHDTVGTCLLEAMIQANQYQEAVLVSLFDTAVQETYKQIFPCDYSFAAALLVVPESYSYNKGKSHHKILANISMSMEAGKTENGKFELPELFNSLYQQNPVAKVLPLLTALAKHKNAELQFSLGKKSKLAISFQPEAVSEVKR